MGAISPTAQPTSQDCEEGQGKGDPWDCLVSWNFSNLRQEHYSWRRRWRLLCWLVFSSGSGWVNREWQMHFNCSPVPTHCEKLRCWQRRGLGGTQLAMIHLFLKQILRVDLLLCQEAAKYIQDRDNTQDSEVSTPYHLPPCGRWTVSKSRCIQICNYPW